MARSRMREFTSVTLVWLWLCCDDGAVWRLAGFGSWLTESGPLNYGN